MIRKSATLISLGTGQTHKNLDDRHIFVQVMRNDCMTSPNNVCCVGVYTLTASLNQGTLTKWDNYRGEWEKLVFIN